MTDMAIRDDKIYIASAYNVSSEHDNDGNIVFEYNACIFVYDLDGTLLDTYSIGGSEADRFTSLLLLDNSIVAVGYTKSKDIDIKNLNYYEKMTEGMIVEFDYDGNIIKTNAYGGKKNDALNDIVLSIPSTENLINDTKNYIIVGYSNSRTSFLKGNNKDYFGKVLKYDSKLELVSEK